MSNPTLARKNTTTTTTAVVGSLAQVANGIATHTSINAAVAAVAAGSSILVLAGTYVENIVVNKQLDIEGQGRASLISGTLQLTSTSDYSSIGKLKVGGNITVDAGATGNIITNFWLGNGFTVTNNGTDTVLIGVTE